MNRIAICLLTYNRFDYALKTLKDTLDNIRCEDGVHVHIADDGSPNSDNYRMILEAIAASHPVVRKTSSTNSMRGGYGKNYNLAMQAIHCDNDYILPLEDDWELTKPLDLDFLVRAMIEEPRMGCIRLGYLGHTQPLRGEVLWAVGQSWLLLDPESPEPHVFAGHPRLELVEWERRVGPWPEGLTPGETEFKVAHNPEARKNVVWPIDEVRTTGNMYAHFGAVRSY